MNALAAVAAAAVLVAVVAARVLAAAIRALRSDLGRPPVATLPLVAEQDLALPEAGDWVLHVEGPLLTRRFAGLDWTLVDRATGVPIAVRRIWLRETRSGVSRARLSVRRFTTPRPGTFLLRTTGLGAGSDSADASLLVMRPGGAARYLAVATTVLSAAVLLVAVVGVVSSAGLALGGRTLEDVLAPGDAPPAPDAASVGADPRTRERALDSRTPESAREHETSGGAVSPSRGGRGLRAARAAARGWHGVAWPTQRMAVEVPSGWEVTEAAEELQVRFAGEPSAYLVGHATPALSGVPAGQLLDIHRRSAAEHLVQDLIDGWAEVRLGALPGVLTIERRGGGERMLVWNGVRATPHGAATVTLLLGVNGQTFDAHEPVLSAILESVRFDG